MPRRRADLLTGRAGVRQITWKGRPAFYRVTGYTDARGRWVQRNPRTGHWYYKDSGRHKAKAPTTTELRESERLNVELDVGDGKVRYFSMPGSSIG